MIGLLFIYVIDFLFISNFLLEDVGAEEHFLFFFDG